MESDRNSFRWDYLELTRKHLWNDDYFAFLVDKVWGFHTPLRILDFGCGFGYLGLKLLPLLPDASSYTGIDQSEELLEKARQMFEAVSGRTDFIRQKHLAFIL